MPLRVSQVRIVRAPPNGGCGPARAVLLSSGGARRLVNPIVGLGLDGPAFIGAATGRARLGRPAWGPTALLRDLELRLGIPDDAIPRSMRVPRYAARLRSLDDRGAFYRCSFEIDPIGTAAALLGFRDALVAGGWNGADIPAGGERLAALARLERHGDDEVPRGDADRLARVLQESRPSVRLYDEIVLVDRPSDWPGLWSSIFDALAAGGTRLREWNVDLSGAPRETDLGRLQESLRRSPARSNDPDRPRLTGDGTVLVLRGETPTEIAALTASRLAGDPRGSVVVRSRDAYPLDAALVVHGLAAQGTKSASAWRPAMQVLPLAVELAFEPRDPHRALELLTLSVGPFRGIVGSRLARAVARAPGIGGREWVKRRDEARELLREKEVRRLVEAGANEDAARAAAEKYVTARLQRIAEWLETEGDDPRGARADNIRAVADRVRTFLLTRMDDEPEIYGPAFAQAHAFVHALAHDEREMLSREATRQLLDTLVRASHDHARTEERAGRVPHVGHPAALLAPCETLIFWNFVSEAEHRPTTSPWNAAERDALRAHGVVMRDPSRELRRERDEWRRAILATRSRVLFVIPASTGGKATHPHSMWDEISSRLRVARSVVCEARDILEGRSSFPIERLEPLVLPDSPGTWSLVPGSISFPPEGALGSATSFETLVTCPLRWLLQDRAQLRSGAIAKVSSDAQLCGNLGHRLVEELHIDGAFVLAEQACLARASEVLSLLLAREGATLLLPGMAFERAQLVPQLLRAVRELRRYLVASGSTIAGVEEVIETDTPVGKLSGRLDIRLLDREGSPALLDSKWGESRYRSLLERGRAVQLAVYTRSLRVAGSGALPAAGYFALRSGRLVTADARLKTRESVEGPSLDETWSRVERTARAVTESIERGSVPVAGTRHSLPLLEALAIPDAERRDHYQPEATDACGYCSYGALCGRAWEALR